MPPSDAVDPPNGEFIPLYFANKLRMVNSRATVGVVTLWSKIDLVYKQFTEAGIDLNPTTSRIAVFGNLYGNGLPHLLRNLLYNPQITDIIVCGTDKSNSASELEAFFKNGLEKAASLNREVTRIIGTNRLIDEMVTLESFAAKPRIHQFFGDLRSDPVMTQIREFLTTTPPLPPLVTQRIKIGLPKVEVTHYPSDPGNHSIARNTPLEAWRELVFRITRFGHLTHLAKGDRQELQNVRVLITTPKPDSETDLARFGFTLGDFENYQTDMLKPEPSTDHSYTYGNRIGGYYGFDALDKFADRLKHNPQDRDCFLALWDSHSDIDAEDSPCLVSIFFRVYDEHLTLTATYRTHNALDAWLKNVYGLMNVQQILCEKTALPIGPLTVISHSISIDPGRYDFARRVSESKVFSVDMDPNGHFTIAVESGEIILKHFDNDGILLNEYHSRKAERLQHEINRDCAIAEIGHALYVGRQLARAERCIETGEAFEEE